jgi:hypothetical protein
VSDAGATRWLPLLLPLLDGGVIQVALEGLLEPLPASGTVPSSGAVTAADALMLGMLRCGACCVALLGALHEVEARAEVPMGSRPAMGTTRLRGRGAAGHVSDMWATAVVLWVECRADEAQHDVP